GSLEPGPLSNQRSGAAASAFLKVRVPVSQFHKFMPDGAVVAAHGVPDDVDPIGLSGLFGEIHAQLRQHLAALLRVTFLAREDNVLPFAAATASAGHNVVDRELLTNRLHAAVLTGEVVAQIDIPAIEFHRAG